MPSSSSRILEDVRIGVRLKISALWVAMLLLFAYGDIFGFFAPGQIEEVMGGEVSGMEITQVFLFAASVYIAIGCVMVFLTLVLKPSIARWTNVVLSILYIASIVASAIGESGVLPLPERRGDHAPAADPRVRLDVAPAAGSSVAFVTSRDPLTEAPIDARCPSECTCSTLRSPTFSSSNEAT